MFVQGLKCAALARALLLGTAVLICSSAAHAAVTISDKPTSNMNCTGGVCSPTAKKANLNVTDLANMLASGDTKVVADTAARDIDFKAPLSWTSTSRLTLDSYRSIVFQQPVTVAGSGGMTIATNDGGSDGDFWFEKKGHIEFWDLQSVLTVNGSDYTLLNSPGQLSGDITANPYGLYALAASYSAKKDGTYSHSPISASFSGSFEGLGNTISDLKIDSSDSQVGFFGNLDCCNGVVRDLNLTHVTIKADGKMAAIGGLAGSDGGIGIERVNVSVKIATPHAEVAGGIVGSHEGFMSHCSSSGSVIASRGAGGLAGYASYGPISESHSTASVEVTDSSIGDAGGLVGNMSGYNDTHGIFYSYATGTVVGSRDVGGLVGASTASISHSFATGNVMGGDNAAVGGLVGSEGYVGGNSITAAYATGSVETGQNGEAGGLIGLTGNLPISQSYSTGSVQSSSYWAGGFVGINPGGEGIFADDYWDIDTSGMSHGEGGGDDIPGVIGLTDAQLKSALPDGFDPKVWGQNPDINNGYPYLLANPPPK